MVHVKSSSARPSSTSHLSLNLQSVFLKYWCFLYFFNGRIFPLHFKAQLVSSPVKRYRLRIQSQYLALSSPANSVMFSIYRPLFRYQTSLQYWNVEHGVTICEKCHYQDFSSPFDCNPAAGQERSRRGESERILLKVQKPTISTDFKLFLNNEQNKTPLFEVMLQV